MQFLVTNANKYRIDPEQIIVGGNSAGAEAVLNAVYNPQLMFSEPDKFQDIDIDGVFSLAGAVVDARYLTSKNAVPGVFFHGTKDNLVPYATAPHHLCEPGAPGYLMLDGSKTIVQKLKDLNTSYLLYSFEGGKHEHSGVPFNELDNVFDFFQRVFLNNEQLQMEVWR